MLRECPLPRPQVRGGNNEYLKLRIMKMIPPFLRLGVVAICATGLMSGTALADNCGMCMQHKDMMHKQSALRDQGIINKINDHGQWLTLRDRDQAVLRVNWNQNTKILKQGKPLAANRLKSGEFVRVRYEKQGNQLLAQEIRALPHHQQQQAMRHRQWLRECGTIEQVNANDNTFKVLDPHQATLGVVWNNQTKFFEQGKRIQASQLKAGEQVRLTYEKENGQLLAKDIYVMPEMHQNMERMSQRISHRMS